MTTLTCAACGTPTRTSAAPGETVACKQCGAELRVPAPDVAADREDAYRQLEDAAEQRLVALAQRAVGRGALVLGPLALVGLWLSGAEDARGYGVAAGVALVGLLLTLFGETVTERLRRRRRRPGP